MRSTKKSCAAYIKRCESSGACSCRCRSKSAVHDIEIEVYIDDLSLLCKLVQRIANGPFDALRLHFFHWQDMNSCVLRNAEVFRRVCKGLDANLRDVLPRQTIFEQRAHRISIPQTAFERAQVKVRVQSQ